MRLVSVQNTLSLTASQPRSSLFFLEVVTSIKRDILIELIILTFAVVIIWTWELNSSKTT